MTALIHAFFFILLSSCLVVEGVQKKIVRGALDPQKRDFTQGLKAGEGRVFADNPIIVMDDHELDASVDMNRVLLEEEAVVPISDSTNLIFDCGISYRGVPYRREECLKNDENPTALPLVNEEKKWAYDANTADFLQVNAFGHSRKIIEKWFEVLVFLYGKMAFVEDGNGGVTEAYPTALPQDIFQNGAFWFDTSRSTLRSYSSCDERDNAYYSPADNILCYGQDSENRRVAFAQDPTIVYHEVGHALQEIMLNIRNFSAGVAMNADMGILSYDEAGAIGEGVSDYFSYFVTGRTHFAEWALGRFLRLSRPLTEDDPLHVPGISSAESERPTYPDYLAYDPNRFHLLFEGVHNAGMIISHYLTALTRDLKETCSWEQEEAVRFVSAILIEVYGEMGDLTAKGQDGNPAGFIHLNADNAWEWVHVAQPINYRKFAQTMARKLYVTLGDGGGLRGRSSSPWGCGEEGLYPKGNIERLLDSYGLLLFDTYNLDGDGANGHSGTHTGILPETNPTIDSVNRTRTVMATKKYLILDPEPGAPEAYIFDQRSNIRELLQDMTARGQIQVSDKIASNLPYNNGNGKISSGELVGVALNLYNNSNVTMGGIQVLAGDWDHVKGGAPCSNLGDNFPADRASGAADLSTGEGVQGGCDYTTRYNGGNAQAEPLEELAPVCLVQINTENNTFWVQQDRYLEQIGETDREKCLGDSTKDCLVRVVCKGGISLG